MIARLGRTIRMLATSNFANRLTDSVPEKVLQATRTHRESLKLHRKAQKSTGSS